MEPTPLKTKRLEQAKQALETYVRKQLQQGTEIRTFTTSALQQKTETTDFTLATGISQVLEMMQLLKDAMGEQGWASILGWPHLGWLRAHELGIDLERIVTIPKLDADENWVCTALLEDFQVLVLGPNISYPPAQQRIFWAKAKRNNCTVITYQKWQGIKQNRSSKTEILYKTG